MNQDDFRILHSKIIEQYQITEHELEGLYALMEQGDFEELAHRVENDAMGELIRKVKFLDKVTKCPYLDLDDFDVLNDVRNDRNFWCHQVFLDLKDDPHSFSSLCTRALVDLKRVTDINNKLIEAFKKIM